jgi:hypothetical protein
MEIPHPAELFFRERRRRLALELAGHQGVERLSRLLALIEDGVYLGENRCRDAALLTEPVEGLGAAVPLDDRLAAGKELGDGLARANLLAELAIAAPAAVAGGDEIAETTQAVEGVFDPQRIVRGVANRFETVVGSTVTREDGVDPLERLRETLAEYVPPREVEGLPRFWGGAVGYVTYDAVRRFEPKVGAALGPTTSGSSASASAARCSSSTA